MLVLQQDQCIYKLHRYWMLLRAIQTLLQIPKVERRMQSSGLEGYWSESPAPAGVTLSEDDGRCRARP